MSSKRSKRGAEFELTKDTAAAYRSDDGRDGGGGGPVRYGIPRAPEAELQKRRFVRASPPSSSPSPPAAAGAAAAPRNPFAGVNLLAGNGGAGGSSAAAPASSNPFAASLFSPPPSSAPPSFGGGGGAAPAAGDSASGAFRARREALDRKLWDHVRRSDPRRDVAHVRELVLTYVRDTEVVLAAAAAAATGDAKRKARLPDVPAGSTPSAPPFGAGPPPPFAAPAVTGGGDDDADGEDGDAADEPPSFSSRPSNVNDGFDVLDEYENVTVFRRERDGGTFKRLTQSKLVLQRSKEQPSLSWMMMREPEAGIRVIVNMVVQGDYTYGEKYDPKRRTTFGQIGFLGQNSEAEGVRPFALKAPADVARPLHRRLQELSAAYDAFKKERQH